MKAPIADPQYVVPSATAHRRFPAVALDAMVATSQPLATQAALGAMQKGGNAVDAAITAAAVLCVVEPMWTGLGGDCFAMIWQSGAAIGLASAGPAPVRANPVEPVEERGPRSVTVPGAVAGWEVLSNRYGKLGFDACLSDAIDLAERGFGVTPVVAWHWGHNERPLDLAKAPRAGERVRMPELASTLRSIAQLGSSSFYEGPIARAIAGACWLEEQDLAGFSPEWVMPMRIGYRNYQVLEMPPPTQGVAVLEGLGLLEGMEPGLPSRIDAVRLALDDARRHVREGADVNHLVDPGYLQRRRQETAKRASEPAGGTIYISVVDADRMAVSFIQSLYMPFGSRVMVPGTGILLQNRGACFSINGKVEPGRRPYHTILPALLLQNDRLCGAFGCVGGFIQAQAHVQIISNLIDDGLDPQAALDHPRFMVEGDLVRLEQGLWHEAEELERRGYRPTKHPNRFTFGAGQMVLVTEEGLVGGSDSRKDGYAAGF